ncbi:MAG: tetratricopeptide repeat protein [Deltaproteobacteria bacterium]|nr:tetratricopeptide repeat protein [Deltaproteobacteria bacterium]
MNKASAHNIGDIINNRYRLVESIGQGATGEVFVGIDQSQGEKRVAVKYLKWLLGKPLALEQFKTEFLTLTHLSHPHIAKVYDFEQDQITKRFFFTSELIDGRDFITATHGLAYERIEELFVQVLRALEYLHGNGIFHFDIKSANILVGETVKLIDFGLSTIRFQGKLVGTPSYMAPEMVRRENPDGRADLYSLGVIAYSVFAGINPFRTQNVDETLENQLKIIPPPPSKHNPSIPPYMDDIILKLLEKRPQDRYQTAGQAIRDLSLRSPKRYFVETEETRDSYIPWESQFIGRKKEISTIKKFFKEQKAAVIIVRGKEGSGKSRFLNELKYLAQISEWTTASLADSTNFEEWGRISSALHKQPFFACIDDYHILSSELWGNKIESICKTLIAGNKPVILAIATDGNIPPFISKAKNITEIDLLSFSLDEIKEYLKTLTGLESPPNHLVQLIHSNTLGNPFLVTELIKALVTDGLLIDTQGRWKKSTFEDIKIDLNKLQMPSNLKDRLLTEFIPLPEEAKRAAEMLSVFDKPVNIQDAETCMGKSQTKRILSALLKLGLIKLNARDGTYYFSNRLMAKAIYKQMPEKNKSEWHDKIAKLEKKGSSAELYHTGHGSNATEAKNALAKLIDKEADSYKNHDAIANAQYYIKRWNEPRMVLNLARLYNRIGKFDLAIKTVETLQKLEPEFEITALEIIGIAYLCQMNFNAARQYFFAALQSFTEPLSPQKLRIENFLAETAYFEGNIDKAIEIYERTAEASLKLPLKDRLLIKNNNLGQSYFQKGDYKRATECLEKEVELYQDSGDSRLIARARYMLAESYRMERKFGEALSNFNILVEYSKSVNDLEHLFRAYNGLGNLHLDNNKLEDAAACYERALDISSRFGFEEESIPCLTNLGIINSNMGNLKKADEYLSSSLAFLEGEKTNSWLAEQYHCRVHLELGELRRLQGRFDDAKKHLDDAEKLASATNELNFWIKLTQAKLAKGINDSKGFESLMAKAKELADTENKRKSLKETIGT